MNRKINYNVGKASDGSELIKCHFEWYSEDGQQYDFVSDDLDAIATVVGLLTGEIGLGDLEP